MAPTSEISILMLAFGAGLLSVAAGPRHPVDVLREQLLEHPEVHRIGRLARRQGPRGDRIADGCRSGCPGGPRRRDRFSHLFGGRFGGLLFVAFAAGSHQQEYHRPSSPHTAPHRER
jgi:hypothetical protein